MSTSRDELKAKIGVILSQSDDRQYYRWVGPPVSVKAIFANPGAVQQISNRVDLLRRLYGRCASEEREEFVKIIRAMLDEASARAFVHLSVEVGILADVVMPVLNCARVPLSAAAWDAITEKLKMESHLFSDAQIVELLQIAKSTRREFAREPGGDPLNDARWPVERALHEFEPTAKRVQYLRLRRDLREGHNPEINTDKQELISRMTQLGFRAEIVATLQELDGKVFAAVTPLDFKSCMDAMRTVYEEIVEDAAKAVASITNVTYPPPKTDFWPWNKLLMENGILNADEGELTQKLYATFSNVASHRLGSAPEQLRVTKNMMIELGLLVVGRVQALKSARPSP